MHSLRVLLLILLSLGIQVPGGVAFEMCLCQGISGLFHEHGGGEAGGCCAGGRELPAENAGDCCGSAADLDQGGPDDCRGCIELTTPEHEPPSAPPAGIALAHVGTASLLGQVRLLASEELFPIPSGRTNEPPGERTYLPLRI